MTTDLVSRLCLTFKKDQDMLEKIRTKTELDK